MDDECGGHHFLFDLGLAGESLVKGCNIPTERCPACTCRRVLISMNQMRSPCRTAEASAMNSTEHDLYAEGDGRPGRLLRGTTAA